MNKDVNSTEGGLNVSPSVEDEMLQSELETKTELRQLRMTQIKNTLKDIFVTAGIAVLISFIVLKFICITAVVPTGSMKPTINEGDKIIVWECLKYFDFKRGDLIVFDGLNTAQEDKILVKRVIGLPGETVKITDGVVYINGVALEEDYVKNDKPFFMDEVTVPEDEYFVLGDNRANSFDARYWSYKFVKQSDIMGKGMLTKFIK